MIEMAKFFYEEKKTLTAEIYMIIGIYLLFAIGLAVTAREIDNLNYRINTLEEQLQVQDHILNKWHYDKILEIDSRLTALEKTETNDINAGLWQDLNFGNGIPFSERKDCQLCPDGCNWCCCNGDFCTTTLMQCLNNFPDWNSIPDCSNKQFTGDISKVSICKKELVIR